MGVKQGQRQYYKNKVRDITIKTRSEILLKNVDMAKSIIERS